MTATAVLIHFEYLFVGDKRGGRGIVAGQIAAEYQWRTEDAP